MDLVVLLQLPDFGQWFCIPTCAAFYLLTQIIESVFKLNSSFLHSQKKKTLMRGKKQVFWLKMISFVGNIVINEALRITHGNCRLIILNNSSGVLN